jgi:tetratricopeptide (TPR) repeat protein
VNPRPTSLPPSGVATHRLAVFGLAAAMVLAVIAAYRGTFAVPFVLDDTQAITDNYSIRHFTTAWSPPAETTVTGRPLVNLSLALNYAIGGLEVRGYHVINLTIHLLAALTLFGIIRRTLLLRGHGGQALMLSAAVALLWALHPLQTESVTYTIQRAESLMGLFYLLTLYAFIRGTSVWLAVSCVACLLGMATKEVMVGAPLIVLLYDRTFVAGNFRDALRARRGYYAALSATWLVLVVLVIGAEGRGGTAGLGTKIAPVDYALTQCRAIVHYLWLSVWPTSLIFDYGKAAATPLTAALAPGLLLLALLTGTVVALRRSPVIGFLGAWFFAILAPSSSIVPIATQAIAEHRMYLSLAAVITLIVLAVQRWLGSRATWIGASAAIAGFAWLTHERNATYRDALTLWTDTAAKAPTNTRAFANLGITFLQLGRLVEAQQSFEAAVRLAPNDAESHINLANVLLDSHRFDEGVAHLETALRLDPGNVEAENNLGITLAQGGRLPDAIRHFERALQLKPASADTHGNLALALTQAGRSDEAFAHFAESTRLQPLNPLSHDFYGFALLKAGRPPEAIREFEAALRIDPQLARARQHLGLAFIQVGRLSEGLAQLERALQLAPGDAAMHNDLGLALAQSGRLAEALRHFEEAVRLAPDYAEAAQNRDRARAELHGQ